MSAAATLKCPVCAARFRAAPECSRCGSDLSDLMRIAARAWALRQASRQAILAGDLPLALRCAAMSRRLHRIAAAPSARTTFHP